MQSLDWLNAMLATEHAAALLALLASFMFALSAHLQHVGLRHVGAQSATLIVMFVTALIYWAAAPFFISAWYWWTGATALFVFAGLFRPAISMSFWVHGIQLLGPTLNAALASSGPLFAAGIAILLLNEPLTLPTAIGTLAVVIGVMVASQRSKNTKQDWPLWAVLLPLGAAFLRAIANAVTKIGFEEVPSALFASMVSTTVSLVILCGLFIGQKRRLEFHASGYRWLVTAGIVNALAVYLLAAALKVGKLIVVAPVIAISPIFAMGLGLLFFRGDKITLRKVMTIAFVVPGVILVIVYG